MRATRVRTLVQSFGSAPLCETLKQWLRGYTAHAPSRARIFLLLPLSAPFSPFFFIQPPPLILPLTCPYTFSAPLFIPLCPLLPWAFTVLLLCTFPQFTILDNTSVSPFFPLSTLRTIFIVLFVFFRDVCRLYVSRWFICWKI